MKIFEYNYKIILLNIVLAIVISITLSCEEEVNLKLPVGDEKLVVDGWITNEKKPYAIRLYRTIGFSNADDYPPVNEAEVFITDRLSIRHDFIENGITGIYKSDTALFVGKQGEAYVLNIILKDGTTYQSRREALNPLSEILNIRTNFFIEAGLPVNDPKSRKYFIEAFVNDIQNVRNYYRWKIYVNGELRNTPNELFLFDDKFFDGVIFRVSANKITMEENDVVVLEHRSLTANAYSYFEQLEAQLSSGIIPNTPPAIVFSNIRNVADSTELVLGYFGASAVSQTEIVITP